MFKKIFLSLITFTVTVFGSWNVPEKPDAMILFCGNANLPLAKAVAAEFNHKLEGASVSCHNDKEIKIQFHENVRNQDVFVIQSTCTTANASVNDNIMELYLMVRALKRASAKSVTAIIPYFGYARQDRKSVPRVPISAADVAMMIETAGADRVVSIDLHCGQIQGFFQHIPVDNLYASRMLVPYFAQKELWDPVVVSPDAGGVSRAKYFREKLAEQGIASGFGIIIKQREEAGKIAQMDCVGDVYGRDVIIVDDMCDTGGTLTKAAEELKRLGARDIYACITHPVFSGPAMERIENSCFTEVVVTDTIPLRGEVPSKVKQLTVAPLLAEVIRRLQNGESISKVFR